MESAVSALKSLSQFQRLTKNKSAPIAAEKIQKNYFLYLPPSLLYLLELPAVVSREAQAGADRGRGQSKNECLRKIKEIYKSQGSVNHAYL